jgi:hypothetical protein
MAFAVKRKPVDKRANNHSLASSAKHSTTPVPHTNEDIVSDHGTSLFSGHELDLSIQEPSSLVDHDDSILPALLPVPHTSHTKQNNQSSTSSTSQSLHTGQIAAEASPNQKPASYISWGINWQKPIFIWTMLFSGLILALGHHLYYLSLNGTLAGDAAKQAWPIRFGTAFAFLVTSCLQAVTTTAIGQHFWSIVRRKSLTLGEYLLVSIRRHFDVSNPG